MLLIEGEDNDVLLEGGLGGVLFEGETPDSFTDYELADQIQDHFHATSPDLIHLLDAVQEIFHQGAIEDAKKMPELKNPDKVPIELIGGLEEMLDVSVPQIRSQTEESRRRQLKRATDWIRIKGREIAVRSYLQSAGFIGETEVMVSDDYQDFKPTSDALAEFGTVPDSFFYTPHVDLTFSNTELINGEILTEEIFDILSNRILQLSPATAVYHYTFQIHGDATEDKETLERNFVKGSVSDTYQGKDAEEFYHNHKAGDGVQAVRDFEYMDVEFWDEWKIGTYSGDVADFNSFDSVLKTSTDMEIKPRPDLNETRVFAEIGDNVSGSYNAIAFYHNDEIRALFKFPEMNILPANKTDVEFVAHVQEKQPKWHHTQAVEAFKSRKMVDNSPVNYFFVTDEYDFSWDRDGIEANWGFTFNGGLKTNDTGKRFFASVLSQPGSYYKLGRLNGKDPSDLHIVEDSTGQPKMNDPVSTKIDQHNFDLEFRNKFDRLIIEADMVHSEVFDEDIDQIGFFDENGHLLLVAQLDTPMNISDQFNRDTYRLRLGAN